MASATASITISKVLSPSTFIQHKPQSNPLKLPVRAANSQKAKPNGLQLTVKASSSSAKEKAITGLTAAALVAVMVVPEIAEAAQPGLSPSLKNFLLSIVSGGVVLGVIVGAVIGVSNFDPVKRT
ncbi:hypothetical protein KFK09_001185 [Dendrobium nobile]|uniref:Ultraviolet-B-repressible protein n=1 Tax=Dendrobium nobile TaxID=94219 RepID=A0A8T3C4G3_DENNO|nr:hypothetical protein KFK09_001185 [Dendrobium nobile]